MPTGSQYQLYFDNQPATDEQKFGLINISVDQAMGMASEAVLVFSVTCDEQGVWSKQNEDYLEPYKRVRIEIKASESADFKPVIDGPIVAQNFLLSATPGESVMQVSVHDDSALLNVDESVEVFEDMSPADVATQLISLAGLTPEVSVNSLSLSPPPAIVQRGTAMQCLMQMAKANGLHTFVRPGNVPGQSIGYFTDNIFQFDELAELKLLGNDRNINEFTVNYDGLQPLKSKASQVNEQSLQVENAEAQTATANPLGDESTHDFSTAGTVLLSRTAPLASQLEAATQAAVDFSSWAYTANAAVVQDAYPDMLTPYAKIVVTGVGDKLSGEWLITHVSHSIDDSMYQQTVTLKRNARNIGTGGGLLDAISGVF